MVEAAQNRAAIAGSQRRAGLAQKIVDAAQADAFETGDGVGIETQRGDRQGREGGARLALRNDPASAASAASAAGTEPGHRPGRAGSVGDRAAGREAAPFEPAMEACEQTRLAAEQTRAAGDVEPQAVAARCGNPRY